jgi:hypothetical protein
MTVVRIHIQIGAQYHMVSHRNPYWVTLFLIYINDLPIALNRISSPILFADDTSVIIPNPDPLLF